MLVLAHGRTEQDYLAALSDFFRDWGIAITVEPSDQSHQQMWQEAKRRITEGYELVAVVRDVDFDPQFPKLANDARQNPSRKLILACSNPCFEYWLLLHVQNTDAPFFQHDGRGGCSQEAVQALRQKNGFEYYKKAGWTGHDRLVKERRLIATSRAKTFANNSPDQKYESNPSTYMFALVEALETLAEPNRAEP